MLRSLLTLCVVSVLTFTCTALAPPVTPAGCDNSETTGKAVAASAFSVPVNATTLRARRNSVSLAANARLAAMPEPKPTWSIYVADEWRPPEEALLNIRGIETGGSSARTAAPTTQYNITGTLRDSFRTLPYFFVRLVIDDASGRSVRLCSYVNGVGDVDPVIAAFNVDTKAEQK